MNERLQFCTFRMGQRLYGMRVEEVREVTREVHITRVPLSSHLVRGLINMRGRIVTAIDLRKGLGLDEPETNGSPMNVVVNCGEQSVSFLVDAIGDVLDVEEEAFEDIPETLQGGVRSLVSGVYKLENGLLHVLDASKCAQLGEI